MGRGIVAVAGFTALPIARLLANNPGESLPVAHYAVYWAAAVVVIGFILLLVARNNPAAKDRVATATALIVFSFTSLAMAIQSALHVGAILTVDGSIWIAASLVASAVLLSKFQFTRRLAPVLALFLLSYPVAEIVAHAVEADSATADLNAAGLNLAPVSTPNIYWIVADGYAGPDVITDDYGYEEEGTFLRGLEDLDFAISGKALAAYPMTHLSMASTLAMDYVVDATDNISDPHPFYRAVQGDNPVVTTLRSWGYEFLLYPGGFYAATQCSGEEDACLGGVTLDPADRALLAMTPIASLIQGPRTARTHAELGNPLSVLESLDDYRTRSPTFVLAHLLNPHPPFYRGGRDCDVREVTFNLGAPWQPDEEYVGAVRCLNELLLSMLQQLIAADPDAVIILQGDHGPNLGIAFEHGYDVSAWSDRQVRTRFSVLSAMRLPEGCNTPGGMSLVNTFRAVLGCLSDESIPLLPTRTFTVNAHPGDVEEIGPPL